MDQFLDVLKQLGIDPALAGIGIVLAILLRYARGMVHWMNSEWTFATAFAFGIIGAFIGDRGMGHGLFAKDTLSLMCIVLVFQKVLEKAATVFPWLPTDNQWVNNNQGGTK